MKAIMVVTIVIVLVGVIVILLAGAVRLHRGSTPSRKERQRSARQALADGIRRGDRRAVESVLIVSREDLPADIVKDAQYWLLTGKSIHE